MLAGRIFRVQSNGVDLVLGIPRKFGVGYGLLPMPQVLSFLPGLAVYGFVVSLRDRS